LSVGLIPILLLPQIGTFTFALSNNNAYVYPNPYKKGDAKFGGNYIYFGNVSYGAVIKIYNIAGELVDTIDAGQSWNVSNIASGVYIYTVTGGSGGKKVGKIGITKWE
ncbi:MAG: T9SS type A sorting domain-containing protein, partial [bacterium]|nr:T9SS type A sorting domain-containing protein [bacterium]